VTWATEISAGSPVREDSVVVGGVSAPTWETGPADGREAIVFVHGLPGSGREFGHLLPSLGDGCRTLAFDLPGFGQADKPADYDYSSHGFADFIEGALGALGIERVHLAMHDFGCGWGLEWAIRHVGSVESVLMINSGLLGEEMHWLPAVWRTPVIGELAQAVSRIPLTRMLLWHGNPRGLPKWFVDGMYAHYDRGTRRAVLRMYRRIEKPKPMLARLADVLAPLDLPSLLLWGVHDPYIPVECAERARLLFPSTQISYFRESGHWPFIDDADRTQREMVEFFAARVGDRIG
jgi:pimeloyl-ACP methyl ester carboxylesterase